MYETLGKSELEDLENRALRSAVNVYMDKNTALRLIDLARIGLAHNAEKERIQQQWEQAAG